MPYFITDAHPDCPNWAVVKSDGELIPGGCHATKGEAIEQMVAVSLAEDLEPGGDYQGSSFRSLDELQERAEPGELNVGDFVRWRSSGGTARGQIERILTDGTLDVPDTDFSISATEDDPAALIRIYRSNNDGEWGETETLVGHKFSTLTKIEDLRAYYATREVNLDPPAYMRAAARQGLKYHEEGLSGDGLRPQTVREARAMAAGNVTADKWVRIAAWISRHLVDLDSPAADPDNEDYPSAGVVAHLLWGSGPSKRAAERALAYARGVVGRLESENANRTTGNPVAELETRMSPTDFEIRETSEGMTFEGYAAMFDSPSQPLPFTEKIAPGAFTRSLKSRNDIKLLWNHSAGEVLGSTRAGTLKLTEDERGLKVWAMLPNTTTGRDTSELIRRGDVDSMSFGFSVPRNGDSWSEDGAERTLNEVRLHEVSIVAFPAYTATAGTTAVRGLERLAERTEVDADSLADALLKVEMGDNITEDDRQLLERVLDKLAPESEAEAQADTSLEMLQLKKKKLELLLGL